jgi:O-antigen/teichoic acid export membrane protein
VLVHDTGPRLTRAFETSVRSLRGQARSGASVFASTVAAGILAYVSVALGARTLGASEFGLLGSLLATASIVGVTLRPLHTGATHLAAELRAHGQASAVAGIVGPSLALAAVAAGGLLALVLAVAQPLSALYRASDATPLVMLALFLTGLAYSQFSTGLLLGQQHFNAYGAANVAESLTRAVLTAPLALAAGVSGVLACYGLGTLVANTYVIARIGGIRWRLPPKTHISSAALAGLWSFTLTFVIALLQNADLVILRTYAPAESVGWYAAAASIGALVFSVAAPIYLPLYPRLVASLSAGQPLWPLLGGTLILVAAAGGAGIALSLALGGALSALLFGQEFVAAGSLLPAYLAKSISLLALFLVGQYAIVAGRAGALAVTLVPSAAGVALLALYQPSAEATAFIGFLSAAACAGAVSAWIGLTYFRPFRASS